MRDEGGVVRWAAVQEELRFAEGLCAALRAAEVSERRGGGVVQAGELLPLLLPELSPTQIQNAITAAAPPQTLLRDPLGWLAATFPTPSALRSVWRVCTSAVLSRIVAAKVRMLDSVVVGRGGGGGDDTQRGVEVSDGGEEEGDADGGHSFGSAGSESASPPPRFR